MTDDELIAGLRAWASHDSAHVRAATELLIVHDHWLWDEGFIRCCVPGSDSTAPYLDFAAMKRYHDEGPPCSEGQAAILLIAADIGSGRWQVSTLDGRNRQRALDAVTAALGLAPDTAGEGP